MSETKDISGLTAALPFWLSLAMVPLALAGATQGGWTVFLLPVYGWIVTSILDAVTDPDLADSPSERVRERLRRAGLLATPARLPGNRPPMEAIAEAGARAATGRTLSDHVSDQR